MRMRFVALVVLLAVGGCASTGSINSEPAVKFSAQPPKPGFGVVYVARPANMDNMVPQAIELDGRPLAQLGFATYTRIELKPGRYTLAPPRLLITGPARPVTVTVEAGKAHYLRQSIVEGEKRTRIVVVGSVVAPAQDTIFHPTFSVETLPASAPPPSGFEGLTYVAPNPASQ